jgi:hypothetical protein
MRGKWASLHRLCGRGRRSAAGRQRRSRDAIVGMPSWAMPGSWDCRLQSVDARLPVVNDAERSNSMVMKRAPRSRFVHIDAWELGGL